MSISNYPPATNKGGSNPLPPQARSESVNGRSTAGSPQNACHIDWLQFTMDWQHDARPEQVIEQAFGGSLPGKFTGKELSGVKGYNAGVEHDHLNAYWHTTMPQQKIMVVFSGTNLTTLAQAGMTQLASSIRQCKDHKFGYLTHRSAMPGCFHRTRRICLDLLQLSTGYCRRIRLASRKRSRGSA